MASPLIFKTAQRHFSLSRLVLSLENMDKVWYCLGDMNRKISNRAFVTEREGQLHFFHNFDLSFLIQDCFLKLQEHYLD